MKKNKLEYKEYKAWLKRAFDDLKWTESNLQAKIYYGACFSAQQAVEKALKSFLLFRQGKFEKIHDLVKLLDDCAKYDSEFSQYREEVAELTFYYLETRYPDIYELEKFTKDDAETAFRIAKQLVNLVSNKIFKL